MNTLQHSLNTLEQSAAALTAAKPAVDLAVAVDELGTLKAQIAALQEREKDLRSIIVDSGQAKLSGSAYDASVSHSVRSGRDDVFKERIEQLIEEHLSRQFIAAHSTETPVVTVRVTARKVR